MIAMHINPGTSADAAALRRREAAHTAGWIAGQASMRAAGRERWSNADYNAAMREFRRLCPDCAVALEELPE